MEPPPVLYATTTDGVSVAWTEVGQGQALLRCGPTPFTHVQEQVGVFGWGGSSRSVRFVTFDARGTGMSEREVAVVSVETLLLDAEAVIDAAKLQSFVVETVPGNALALSTCLHLAIAYPERVTHVVLNAPFQNWRELADTPLARTRFAEVDWPTYTQILVRVMAGFDSGSSEMIERFAKAIGGWVDPSVGAAYIRETRAVDVGRLLPQVRQPTLVLRNDPYFVPARACQRVAAKIPGAQFHQYSVIRPSHVTIRGS